VFHLKKYIIGSLILHLVVLVVAFIITEVSGGAKKSFIVFGAHSRKPSFVLFKTFKIEKPSGRVSHCAGRKNVQSHQKCAQFAGKKHKLTATKKVKRTINKVKNPAPHKHQAQKENAIPEIEPVIHELSDKIKIAHKKSKKQKQASGRKQKSCLKKKELKKTHYDEKYEAEETFQQTEKLAHDESEKETVKEKKLLKQEQVVDTALPDDRPPADIVQMASAPEGEASVANSEDYSGFNLIGNYDQKDLVEYQRHVQREVDRLWRPPLGVPKGTVCTVMFNVGSDGTIEQFEILKRSEVVIYDLSILRVAKSFQFDKSLWGKQFKIDFRQ
jgi:hypothetical protein